ncbi:MAG: rod shape-determining protein MreC [Nitriliruptorales bacterium]
MYERRRARVLLAVLTLVSLLLITVDARSGADGPLSRVRGAVVTAFGPVQEGIATVIEPVSGAVRNVVELFRLREENARLRADLERATQRRQSIEDLERERASLEGLLDMRDGLLGTSGDYDFRAASVIGLAPSNFVWTITIDVGARHGVEKDMAVIDGDGLVGRVIQVAPTASRILLATDRSFSAAVRIPRTGEHGFVEGGGADPLRLTLIDPEADVREDDEVVTASYSDATFPPGIPVGRISSVGELSGTLNRDISVRPYVDYTSLRHVLVVLRTPPDVDLPVPRPNQVTGREQPTAPASPTSEPTPEPSE